MVKLAEELHLEQVEEQITDIKLAMTGSSSSKLWQEWGIKLANLQSTRRRLIFQMNQDHYRPLVEMSMNGTHVLNWKNAIPDL